MDGANQPNLLNEGLESLASLAKRIPSHRRTGTLNPKAVWRWATKGITLPDGQKLRLETVFIAGRYLSSQAALERFISRQQTLPAVLPAKPTPTRTPTSRQQDSLKAEKALDAIGI